MYKPLPDGITIKESNVQGLGVFATKDFDADVVLGIVHILNKNFPHGTIRTALGDCETYQGWRRTYCRIFIV